MLRIQMILALSLLAAGGDLLTSARLPVAEPDRTVLPIPEPAYAQITEIDACKAKAPPQFQVKAPKGAPNVVICQGGRFGG